MRAPREQPPARATHSDIHPDSMLAARMEITRIAIGLRLWLRRAIKRINDRLVDRIVQMVGYKSLRALYNF